MSHAWLSSSHGLAVVAGAALVDDLARPTRLLACRRTDPPALRGGWEFPGGKVEVGEAPHEAVVREVREELGVGVTLGEPVPGPAGGLWPLMPGWGLALWWAVPDGEPRPLEDHDALRWLTLEDLEEVSWLPADLPAVRAVAHGLHPRG